MFIVAGLGNPGRKYAETRHNVGFLFLDHFIGKNGSNFSDSKWKAQVSTIRIWNEKIIFLKPETYMNLSGVAVSQVASFFKIPPGKILVLHDELDLLPGKVKMVCNRGTGGHNGIASIVKQLGSKDFNRIRIGIGRPEQHGQAVSDYVLGKLSQDERLTIEESYDRIEKGMELFVRKDISAAMNYLNTTK